MYHMERQNVSLGKAIYVFRQADGAGIKQIGGVVSLPHLFKETQLKNLPFLLV